MNDFFSRFETLQYSLNLADDTFVEQGDLEKGKEFSYYEEREKMNARKIEFNDKLKAVQLLKALGVDENIKRDILAKVNFNKDPSQVYEDIKTAIRDICGEAVKEVVEKPDEVNIVKPWQERKSERPHYSRSKSRDDWRRNRSWENRSRSRDQRSRSHSRDYDRQRSNERSDSRGRSRNRSVAFQDRRRRDLTPGETVVMISSDEYDRIFQSDEYCKMNEIGQCMILDTGCPRALMGEKQYEDIKGIFKNAKIRIRKNASFKFGPSKIHISEFKVELTLKIEEYQLNAQFFVIKGANIPILLGNDILKPLEGKIDMKTKVLELTSAGKSIALVETPGGHFVIPLGNVLENKETICEENLKGDEAEAVMLVLLEDSDDLMKLHDEIGHAAFVGLALTNDEKTQVSKVHRYFGHRSGRRTWEMFAKAEKLKGKKQDVIELIEKCKICSQLKKAPPRPKIGLPVANDFNEIVGMDLKVLNKEKGEYILWIVDLFSKLIKGKFIKSKSKETIIEAIISTWIVGDGGGPGHPRRGFWADNGGEFLNNDLINFAAFYNIHIKMTSANAPWQNGVVERHHATADIIVEKMLLKNPKLSPQDAINRVSFAKKLFPCLSTP